MKKLAWGYVAIVLTIGLAWMIASPPGIVSDSVSGFLAMRSMERGAAFNHTFVLNPDDITVDNSNFTSWWSPGQYLVPMTIGSLGFDLGQSMLITILLAWLIGVAGFALLWRRLGFSPEVTAISMAVLVSQSYVLDWSRFYHGGELLQWSFLPWFILLALRCRELKWHQVAALALGLILGIVFKSAFAIVGASVIASVLFLEVAERGGPLRLRALSLTARAAVAVGIALAALWFYVSQGNSPAGQKPWTLSSIAVRELLFAAAGPLNSLFGLWKSYIPLTETYVWPAPGLTWPLLQVSLISVLLLYFIIRFSGSSREYLTLLVGVYVCVVAAFSLAFSLDLLISFNERHFRMAGVLFIPGFVAMLNRIPFRAGRFASLGLLAALSLSLTFHFAFPTQDDPRARPVSTSGFSHIYATQAALDALSALDEQLGPGNNLIGVPWPQLALDVQNSRIYNMRLALVGEEYFRHRIFFGRVDNLIVMIPAEMEERGASEVILRIFKEHRDDWLQIRPVPEVEDYVFMYSGGPGNLRPQRGS
jgi:hypothetical protein